MLLDRLLETVAEHVVKLEELASENPDLSDWRSLYLVLHTLQVHAQSAIDFLLHSCSVLGLAASTPLTCIERLSRAGYLDREEAELLKRMARFRNIVVYEYGVIDVEKVETVLRGRGYARVLRVLRRLYDRLRSQG